MLPYILDCVSICEYMKYDCESVGAYDSKFWDYISLLHYSLLYSVRILNILLMNVSGTVLYLCL